MTLRSKFASGALMAASAAVVLTTAMAIPGVSSAQPYDDGSYAAQQACQQQQNNRAVGGAILGGLAGAAIGNGVSRGGGRTGGTIIGGVAGAAVGAGVGSATTNCADYPPPPPGYAGSPGYYDNGAGYYDRDRDAGRGQCGWATREITYPDGASTRDSVRSCRDEDGRWRLVP